MHLDESFLKNILGLQFDQSGSAWKIWVFDRVHLSLSMRLKPGLCRSEVLLTLPTPCTISSGFAARCTSASERSLMEWSYLGFTLFNFLTPLHQSVIPILFQVQNILPLHWLRWCSLDTMSKTGERWAHVVPPTAPPTASPAWRLSPVWHGRQRKHMWQMKRFLPLEKQVSFSECHLSRRIHRWRDDHLYWSARQSSTETFICSITTSSIETSFLRSVQSCRGKW